MCATPAAWPADHAAAFPAGEVADCAARPATKRRRISPAASNSPRENARARAIPSRGRSSSGASASKRGRTLSAQSAAHAATRRRSSSDNDCGESMPALSQTVRSTIVYRAPLVRANAVLDVTPPASTARIAEELFCGVALLALALGPSASRTGHEARCSNTSLEQGPAARGPLRIGTPHRPPAPQRLNPGALPMGVRSPGTASLEAAAARHGRKRLRDCS